MRNMDGFMYDILPWNIRKEIHKREDEWEDWDDLKVAAWVYTFLGKMYSYDPDYRFLDETIP